LVYFTRSFRLLVSIQSGRRYTAPPTEGFFPRISTVAEKMWH
jgi:hypothetical protein